MECRNCQSKNIFVSEKGGHLAPFFMKRVHKMYNETYGEKLSRSPYGKLITKLLNKTNQGNKLLSFRSSIRVPVRICKECNFIGPELLYTPLMLSTLYHDYRENSYNQERITFEPAYKSIVNQVGKNHTEITARVENIDKIVQKYINTNDISNVVDWGGSEGKFIPTSLCNKNVYILDISNEKVCNKKYHKVIQLPKDILIDYVQVCHILEHLASPITFMKDVLSQVKSKGYVYIEVPQDRTDAHIEKFVNRDKNMFYGIHEHLNLYSLESLRKLGQSLGLKCLLIESKELNLEWTKATIVSGLFVKN